MSRKSKPKAQDFLVTPKLTITSKELNVLSVYSRWIFMILLTKWWRGENQNEFYPFSYTELRAVTGFKYNTIAKSIRELQEAGFMEVQHGRLCNRPNKYRPNLYWLYLRDKDNNIIAV